MRFCTQCGTPLAADARFCTGCGSPVAPTTAAPSATPDPAAEHTQAAPLGAQATAALPTRPMRQGPAQPTQPEMQQPPRQQPHAQPAPAQAYATPPMSAQAPAAAQQHVSGGYEQASPWATTGGTQSLSLGSAEQWKPQFSGFARLAAAATLALTTLGNTWKFGADDYDGYDGLENVLNGGLIHATYTQVLPLIASIFVVIACIAQIVLLPNLAGRALSPMVRFVIRAALCAPAVIAILLAFVFSLTSTESNVPGFALALLSFAVGLTIAGLDDATPGLPSRIMRPAAMVLLVIGGLLTLLGFIAIVAESGGSSVWLAALPHYAVALALVAGAVFALVKRTLKARATLWAVTAALVASLLVHAWFDNNVVLAVKWALFEGLGFPFVLLGLGLAMATGVWGAASDEARHAPARAWASWVSLGFGISAACAAMELIWYIGLRVGLGKLSDYDDGADSFDDFSGSGLGSSALDRVGLDGLHAPKLGSVTWMIVLLLIVVLANAATAFLLRTHGMGRLVAVVTASTLFLTIAITYLASSADLFVGLTTDAAILWLPVVAACALVFPASVRAAGGPLLPNSMRSASPETNQAPVSHG